MHALLEYIYTTQYDDQAFAVAVPYEEGYVGLDGEEDYAPVLFNVMVRSPSSTVYSLDVSVSLVG